MWRLPKRAGLCNTRQTSLPRAASGSLPLHAYLSSVSIGARCWPACTVRARGIVQPLLRPRPARGGLDGAVPPRRRARHTLIKQSTKVRVQTPVRDQRSPPSVLRNEETSRNLNVRTGSSLRARGLGSHNGGSQGFLPTATRPVLTTARPPRIYGNNEWNPLCSSPVWFSGVVG